MLGLHTLGFMKTESIYLDNQSTTRLSPTVLHALLERVFSTVGNASSLEHDHGDCAKSLIQESKEIISNLFRVESGAIYFCSGATEAINQVIQSTIQLSDQRSPKIIASAIEHPCVIDTALKLAEAGLCSFETVRVDARGRLDLEDLVSKVSGATLGCFMAANNEIGNIYPLKSIGHILADAGVPFLCDASQMIGKAEIDLEESQIDFLVFSGHKFHAMQGIGGLVLRKTPKCIMPGTQTNLDLKNDPALIPMFFGGGQQHEVRSGTLNVPGIFSLGLALKEVYENLAVDVKRVGLLRDKLWTLLHEAHPFLEPTGDLEQKLCNNLHICMPGLENQFVIQQLRGRVSLSSGSACSSRTVQPSKVLTVMGLPTDYIAGALRIGLSRYTTEAEVDQAAVYINEAISTVKELMA